MYESREISPRGGLRAWSEQVPERLPVHPSLSAHPPPPSGAVVGTDRPNPTGSGDYFSLPVAAAALNVCFQLTHEHDRTCSHTESFPRNHKTAPEEEAVVEHRLKLISFTPRSGSRIRQSAAAGLLSHS